MLANPLLNSSAKIPISTANLHPATFLSVTAWGGVVSREYVQGDFYNGDVDKIITLDSPHEGTGALNMQLGLLLFCSEIRRKRFKENRV